MHKILLVDDDDDFVAATKAVLESRPDYKVLTANDGVFGGELWVSDGTESGTNLVVDIAPGSPNGGAHSFFEFNGRLFFTANDGFYGSELWVVDLD